MKCDVFTRKCMADICTLEYEGDQDSIFFLSNFTCAGDAIGWDFVQMVKTSRISFSSFCEEMTRKYRKTHDISAPFMSSNTFIKWLFAWMGSMKIDFRKEVDPWCKYKPETLACDGTHIGVSMRNMNLTSPVTMADDPQKVPTSHRRYLR